MSIAVITTFPSSSWSVYAEQMIRSFVKYWPAEIPLLVQLDDESIVDKVGSLLRPQDAIACGWEKDHEDFVARNKQGDDPNNYRRQTTRFCHKVFAIDRAYEAIKKQKEGGGEAPRYLIWMDADTLTTKPVSLEDIMKCLPNGEAVSYLGRKDWPHSECGWLGFDLDNGGGDYIEVIHGLYTSDQVMNLKETHDSWVFDHVRQSKDAPPALNLTHGKPGMDIWQHSPMAEWSVHYKGPAAKQSLVQPQGQKMGNIEIQTKNAIPDEQIRRHITENQVLITNWIRQCKDTDEQIVVVSAGPQLIAEDVLEDYHAGKKIVAVKHALDPLRDAGIKPWACILLDPRPHVYDFIKNADKEVIWLVASQVDPKVTTHLLALGCTVWGYHASVGAGEQDLTALQPEAVISGGSATATRGLFVLRQLGFWRIKMFGYDLCYPDKVDFSAKDEFGQPKYLELSAGWTSRYFNLKKCFWSEPQLIAQFQEIHDLIKSNIFELDAVGDGIVPFILKSKRIGDLREARLKDKLFQKPTTYRKLFKWNKTKKTKSLEWLLKPLLQKARKMSRLIR